MEKFKSYYKKECTLVYCPHCKTFYKGVNTHILERFGSAFSTVIETDFNDNICFDDYNHFVCPKCNQSNRVDDTIIHTEDWIANMFFKIKGEK